MSASHEPTPGLFPGFERIAKESETARRIAAVHAASTKESAK